MRTILCDTDVELSIVMLERQQVKGAIKSQKPYS